MYYRNHVSFHSYFLAFAIVFAALFISPTPLHAASLSELTSSSLEELMQQEVTSVSRKQENLYTAPAAVYVITAEDIRRRGFNNIPEALAMAPGVQVRAIDGNKWSIGVRGHSGIYSNKLLVQIDGRSIYTPTFSGVYWDQHEIPMSDIERIEVIRGSGATLWGANAVNGIINIITKHTSDSRGAKIQVSAGNQDDGSASIRYGDQINENTFFRINAQRKETDSNSRYNGLGDANDSTTNHSLHVRLDSELSETDSIELSAGLHDNKTQQTVSVLNMPPPSFFSINNQDQVDLKSFYLKGNWKHLHQNGVQSNLQVFIDHYDRKELYLEQDLITYDLDYQLTLPALGSHNLILGMGYRRVDADYLNSYAVSILPNEANMDLYSFYAQDEYIIVPEQLSLTFGSKFEHHDFTGWEIQPNVRIAYSPTPGHFTWGAISKAVRTPSIAERGSNIQGGLTFPSTTWVNGSMEIDAENVTSYEIGYRYFSSNLYTFDAAFFYNDYDDYLSFEQINPITFQMGNKLSGKSFGVELTSVWQLSASVQLAASYSYLDVEMEADNDSTDPFSAEVLNNSYAKNSVKLHSSWDINQKWSLDTWLYYYDEIRTPSNYALFTNLTVEEAITVNARLAWSINHNLELALKANNIFDASTLESVGESLSTPTEIDRSIAFSVIWDF